MPWQEAKQKIAEKRNCPDWDCMMATYEGISIHVGEEKYTAMVDSANQAAAELLANEAVKSMFQFQEAKAWHEDIGLCMWFKVPVCEPPVITSPDSDDWVEDNYTHFLDIRKWPIPAENGSPIPGNSNDRAWLPFS